MILQGFLYNRKILDYSLKRASTYYVEKAYDLRLKSGPFLHQKWATYGS